MTARAGRLREALGCGKVGAPTECANTRPGLDQRSVRRTKRKPDDTDYPEADFPVNPVSQVREGNGLFAPADRAS